MTTTRRSFITNGLLGFAAATLPSISSTSALAGAANTSQQIFKQTSEPRLIGFRNLHTGEVFSGVYKIGDTVMPDAMEHISHILRDHRTGDTREMDEKLLDYMFALRSRAGQDNDFVVLSGYRSKKTNEKLRRYTEGVAKDSYHVKGRAVDIRIPGYSIEALRAQAKSLRLGGVGFYRSSQFIHLDTGPVRYWS